MIVFEASSPVVPSTGTPTTDLIACYKVLGQYESALECQLTGIDLEATSPIIPFTMIKQPMQ